MTWGGHKTTEKVSGMLIAEVVTLEAV